MLDRFSRLSSHLESETGLGLSNLTFHGSIYTISISLVVIVRKWCQVIRSWYQP